jgi:bacillolysin
MINNVLSKLKPLLTLSLLFTFSAFAQNADKNINEKTQGSNGLPSFITFKETTTYRSNASRQIFTEQLDLKQNQAFISTKTETDQIGYSHEKFQLYHNGIKVEYATYTLHSKNGKLTSMNGDFYHIIDVNTIPAISSQTAFNKAITHIRASKYLWEDAKEAAVMNYEQPKGELVFLPSMREQGIERTADKIRLAYKFDIYATSPVSRGDIYIDAETGEVLYYNATIKHLGEFAHGSQNPNPIEEEQTVNPNSNTTLVVANAETRYSGTRSIQTLFNGVNYTLFDYTRGISLETFNMNTGSNYSVVTKFTDADNNWTAAEYANAAKDNAALDAHWGAEKTFDYFLSTFGRNSYNNTGGNIVSFVHFGAAYNNAYWNGAVMTYGDGNGTMFDALTALDVAGHEIAHAVCETTANLAYQKESGAMNEGFSDIWGACVEYFAAPTKATWLVGEDIERRLNRAALRSMSDPKSLSQPDTYLGTFWINQTCTPTSTNDYCGVHTNSGVLNHWFYVLSVGESGTNDIGSVYNVTGITMDKAAKIAYRLESVYLTANSNYANARTFGIQSATDIYGARSPEVIATTNAFYAVGIGAAYVAPGGDAVVPSVPLNLVASGTTASTTNLSWTAATDNVGVTGYAVFNGLNLIGTTAGLSFNATGLMGATSYTFTVKARDAVGNISAASNPVAITTLVTPVGLSLICSSQGTDIGDERIGRVQFGTIDNITTGGFGYNNYTSISTNVIRDTNPKTITITPTWTGTVYPEGYAVFIDYNADGDFSDVGETVYTRAAATTTPAIGSFIIPATATPGPTRMRVSMRYNAIPTACETFDYGQVEDYTIVIVPPTTVITAKLFIEGYYSTSTHAMRPVKANQGMGISTTDVDTVTIELRDAVTFGIAITTTATLQTNGMVTATFPQITGSYYLAIKHRNGLQTWSAAPLTISAVTPLYDFSTLATKAYGSNMRQVEPGVWAIYSGDINQDGNIDSIDYPLYELHSNNFLSGNYQTDLNGDGNVDSIDYPILEFNTNNFVSILRP